MASISLRKLFPLLFYASATVRAQYDPIVNFCKLIDHQSTIVHNQLYIDGGREIYTQFGSDGFDQGPHVTGINEDLLVIDLSNSWDSTSLPIKTIAKDTSIPSLTRGALYPDPAGTNQFFLFGGTVATDNLSFAGWTPPLKDAKSLWSYDADSSVWKSLDMSPFGLVRPCSGASTIIKEKGLAFYFNGEQDLGSSEESQVLNQTTKFLVGMVVLNLFNQTATNVSTTGVSNLARVRGQLAHIPLAGNDGLLVLLGGGEKESNNLEHDWKGKLVTFDSVPVLDVSSLSSPSQSSGKWYSQLTSGLIPSPRVDPCVVVASAPDNSSHNIYMYGGRDGVNSYYDELWILSLPSFQWVQGYKGNSPRYSMTCHVVGNRQMIVIGGSNTSKITDNCDSAVHGIRVLDLTDLTWDTAYNAAGSAYQVPKQVVDVVGGSPTGGATILKPLSGFQNSQFAALFNASSKNTASTTKAPGTSASSSTSSSEPNTPGSLAPHGSSSKMKLSSGATAGIAIAVILAFLLAATVAIFFIRRRHESANEIQEMRAPDRSLDELGGSELYQLNGGQIHQLNGGEIHQLDHQPLYEAPGSYPPVYEKEASFVSTVSLPASAPGDMPMLERNGAYVRLEQR